MGLGNPLRKDDFAGLLLLNRLQDSDLFRQANYIAAGTNPENYLQKILDLNPRAVIFIDTARFNEEPGTIRLLDRESLDQIRISTHAFSMTLVEDYLNAEREMDFYYIGIEPEDTGVGEGLSPVLTESLKHFFKV